MKKLLFSLLFVGATAANAAVVEITGAYAVAAAAVGGAYFCGKADQKNSGCLEVKVPACLSAPSEKVKAENGNYYFERSSKCSE